MEEVGSIGDDISSWSGGAESSDYFGRRRTSATPAAAAAADAAEAAKAAEAALAAERMEEMKAAMGALKLHQDSAEAHRRVGKALEALGRGEAAARSFLKASELDGKLNSTVEEID